MYEDPDKLASSGQGNYELTQCPAYEATKQQSHITRAQGSSSHYESCQFVVQNNNSELSVILAIPQVHNRNHTTSYTVSDIILLTATATLLPCSNLSWRCRFSFSFSFNFILVLELLQKVSIASKWVCRRTCNCYSNPLTILIQMLLY